MANTKPTKGGVVSGQYLLTHNVNPHRSGKSIKKFINYFQEIIPFTFKLLIMLLITPRTKLNLNYLEK